MGTSKRKIDAIYELRKAAEGKALAEKELEADPGAERRDRLLDAQINSKRKRLKRSKPATNAARPIRPMRPHETITP